MKSWPTKPLGEVCELVNGAPFKPSDWDGSGLPIVRIQNLNDPTKPFNYTSKKLAEKFRVRSGDTLLSWSGTPGTSFGCFRWDGAEGWLNQHIFNVHLGDEVLPAFFIYQVNSKLEELIGKAHGGVGLQHITKGALSSVSITVPPLAEQERIVKLLDQADELRKLRAQADRRATNLIPALFNEMFGDLERNSLGWPSTTLEEVISSTKLGLVRGAKETDNSLPFPYVRMDAILGDGSLALAPIKRVNATASEVAEFSLRDGDFLFNTRNSRELVGKTAIFEGSGTYLFNNNIMRIRFNNSIEPHYIISLFQTDFIKRQLEARKSGTTSVVAIYFKNLSNMTVLVPPPWLQKEFAKRVTEIRGLEAAQAACRHHLDDLFQSMLHRAFNEEL